MRLLLCSLVLLVSCGSHNHPAVEDLSHREDLSYFKLGSLKGTRDGDRLDAQAIYTDSSSILDVEMHFEIGVPTRLSSGTWRWNRNNNVSSGPVLQHSISFLGGQSGPPSLGGSFDLVQAASPRYRITIPLTELKARLKIAPDWQR